MKKLVVDIKEYLGEEALALTLKKGFLRYVKEKSDEY